MKFPRTALLGSLAVALLMAISYRVGRARADGAPTMNPLTYGGYLDDGGRPVDGTRSITVRLWDAASGGTAACTTVSPTTTVTAGRWRVTLDVACATVVQMNPNVWAEVIVDSAAFPRAKIAAVPYALEAGRAAAASGPLATRISAVEAAARPRQVEIGPEASPHSGYFCTTSYTAATRPPPLTITANATAIYRISATVSTAGASAHARIGSTTPLTFLTRLESSGTTSFGLNQISALARLEAGRMYSFGVEVCDGTSIMASSPLVVEQVN